MVKARNRVVEVLQLRGDFPQCTPDTASACDWMHVLAEMHADAAEQCRFDESDPIIIQAIQERLCRIGALCEMWWRQLEGE